MPAFRLARLPFNWREQPQLFERYWDETLNQLEKTLNAILDIPAIQQAVLDAQAAANTAQAAADTAQAVVDNQASETSLVNSYTSGFTPPLITADNLGNVTIANHTRVYGDPTLNPNRSVTGATIPTTATANQIVRVYYDDPTRVGGAVTYLYTIDPAAPPVQSGNRHSVGAVEIPAAGTNDGYNQTPPGYIQVF